MPQPIVWQCPSNIALVKYWGKHGVQLPQNPSVSFTLQQACTQMELRYTPNGGPAWTLNFWFEDQPNEKFREKIAQFLRSQAPEMPFLAGLDLQIRSRNTFPHSAGIASSASSMGALALCLSTLASQVAGHAPAPAEFYRQASRWARLASGSACRSVYGGATVWGSTPAVPGSSDEFAVPLPTALHPEFADYHDTILIVSGAEKSVSSRAGHALMQGHPYAQVRYQQARTHTTTLVEVLANGDLATFIEIVENEALTLHGLMMNSSPSFTLMQPNTLAIIARLRAYRQATGIPVCFTLDAGPNVHLLYPAAHEAPVMAWVRDQLAPLCENGRYLPDQLGAGPILTNG
ncbi:MAG: diphosphomevalonate decarboxylase [Bernardetiaceae bacterium]|jgi:diphosphomevalonate decarboxylase|nr:diphosphomevalonate decarboxylase [Bernardetiaceae bacterium]